MTVGDAAAQLAALLRVIDAEGINVITEDCGTIFLTREVAAIGDFAEVNDHNGRWEAK